MISEVENLTKGNIVKTAEYDACRKLIGVANENLIPNPSGIIPLAKQNCFIVEKAPDEVMETLDIALNPVKEDTMSNLEALNLPVLDSIQTTVEQQPAASMPEAPKSIFTSELSNNASNVNENNMILENPVQVENLDTLTSLSATAPSEIVAPVQNNENAEQQKNVVMDLQMPQMPDEIVATEPNATNNGLFESVPTLSELPSLDQNPVNTQIDIPSLEAPASNVVTDIPTIQSPLNEQTETQHEIIDIDKTLEDKKTDILNKVNELNAEINKCFNELKALLSTNEKKIEETNSVVETKELPSLNSSEEVNPLVNDALNQINNMFIPNVDGMSRAA